jgi:hypothetical protein
MPRQQSGQQKKTVGRVMHEFKHGELKTARGTRKVKSRKQAVAIALHEAGASKYESKKKNEANLRRTKAKERRGETYRDEAEGRGGRRKAAGSGRKTAAPKTATRKTASRKTATRKAATRKTATRKTGTRKAAASGRKTASKPRKATSAPRKTAAASRRTAPQRRGGAEGKTRAELYEQARRRDIPGRSRMSKAQLSRALAR